MRDIRDVDAGIRLRGSLLRLGILQPGGFTAAELSAAALLANDAADACLESSRYTLFVDTVPSPSGDGDSVKLYRITEVGETLLTEEIVKLREEALLREGIPDDVYGSLAELQETIDDIEDTDGDKRAELCAHAERNLRACRSDLIALERLSERHADEFRARLASLETRLASLDGRSV